MEVDVRWNHPETVFIVGSSGSGKTHLTSKILHEKDNLFKSKNNVLIKNVILCYSTWQNSYQQWSDRGFLTKTIIGFPSFEDLQRNFNKFKDKGGTLLILDDLAPSLSKKDIEELHIFLTVTSHHSNVTLIFIGHNLFHKNLRECSLQFHRYVITNNFRDSNQVAVLGRQIFHSDYNFLPAVYKDILKTPFNNLVLNLSPECPSFLRVTSGWFKPSPITIYNQKKN